MYTWGRGEHGRLGHGDKQPREHPKIVENLSSIERISVGFAHMVALDGALARFVFGLG